MTEPRPLVAVACRSCGRQMGETDGPRLYLAACYFARPVTLHCRHCGSRTLWVPVASVGH